MYTLHVLYRGDLYEVAMRDLTIIRISRYIDGNNRRKEIDWWECSDELRREIIQAVKEYNYAT